MEVNMHIRQFLLVLMLLGVPGLNQGAEPGNLVHTPYGTQKAVFDFYFDDPKKIGSALFWVRSLLNPLSEHPYNTTPDEHHVVVVVHGTEIATLAKKNYDQYRDVVERMRYYAEFGVEFKVCALAAHDFGYQPDEFHDFVEVVPSAMNELVYWQQQGHGLITPQIKFKARSTEEIR
jgi:intracellular sulfur oxidation DsrE/DsrF family protein